MSATLIDGRQAASYLKKKIAGHVSVLQREHGIVPGLAILRVGDNPASQLYVNSKCRQSEEVGIHAFPHYLPEHARRDQVIEAIMRLNADPLVHGIIVQLPLPEHLNSLEIIDCIDPRKDVDGLHPTNLGHLMMGGKGYVPCTPQGCLMLLKTVHKSLKGLHAVIIGRSNLVGKPLSFLLLQENCTVSVVHTKTQNIAQECQRADILIAAVGQPRLVKAHWIKPGATVIDVGINFLVNADGSSDVVGDVDFEVAKDVAGAITPVPGGVGPMTVACLLKNVVDAAQSYAERASR
ncbi:MAG: bifunctional 5,10-methylenetetrahydrofolate dehydrogenase/5,10-methenyltetrahydrofolate cyclohydrolase [Holosporales bacterium]